MKALQKKEAHEGIWLVDVNEPTIGALDVKIKIKKTAICGTDIHIYKWDEWAKKTIPIPMTVGHEFMGEIVEVGQDVEGLKIGQRVSGEGHITCGQCRNCKAGRKHLCPKTVGVGVNRAGAFAEYLVIPAKNVFVLPDEITDEEAAILDPLGNAVHTAMSFDLSGASVLITGAGPIGSMAAATCKQAGAKRVVITDINDYRLGLAKALGADRVVNVQNESLLSVMEELKIDGGFDVGLEMSGNPRAFSELVSRMYHGGKIALLGLPPDDTQISWHEVIFKGLFIKGIYGREIFETWYKMTSLLQGGMNVKPIITHRFHVEDFQKGFDAMLSGHSGKVILEWE